MKNNFLHEVLSPYLPIIWKALFAYVVVLAAIIADLWSGIQKAKTRGEYVHAFDIDRTIDKLRKRYNLLLVFSLLDSLLITSEIHSNMIPVSFVLFRVVTGCNTFPDILIRLLGLLLPNTNSNIWL